ncbi:Ig-like domain-containing protein [Agromyces agglutinans]|uniref:Ig-like domain-containing protein n=1 Tax=Agromyces agglutinans TaxID=2662258 RepID=UPI001561C300|nr:Ig-like domain-containing protein [Agromyces agglutinans]
MATGAAVVALVALVGGVAIASDGYRSEQVDLGDGSVWVVNEDADAVGRANTMVHELNAAVELDASRVDVVQRGATVLVVDADNARVSVIDPATAAITDTVAVPPEDPSVSIGGSRVVISSAGGLWSVPISEFAEFDADAEPDLTFGPEAVTSVDDDGRVFAFRPMTGELVEVEASASTTVTRRWQLDPTAEPEAVGEPPQITSVAGRWAVYDPEAVALSLDGRTVDLAPFLSTGDIPLLQAPSTTGDAVAIGTRRGLLEVPLDGGRPELTVAGRAGAPAQPVRHEECLHAAWAEGTASRDCGDGPRIVELDGAGAAATLVFRANGDALVLDAPGLGRSWAAADDYGVIDDWELLLADVRDDRTIERNDPATAPTVETTQAEPTAVDDEFGARPGRATLLPVLLNDFDPNDDVLAIANVDGTLPPGARLDVVSERQELQLTLDEQAEGSFAFAYTIDDGRTGVATANVVVEVRADDENGPPEQRRDAAATVSAGGRVTVPALGEWVDPDGDPFFLAEASVAGPDRVTWSADGVVVFNEATGPGGLRTVGLLVSDGRGGVGAGALQVDVPASGRVALVAESFIQLATTGEEISIEPLRHVRGGTGQVALVAVPAKPDATITADLDRGTFRFQSAVARTHLIEYTVTDGVEPVTGRIRIEVEAPPTRDTTPITVPHTAFVRAGQAVDIDVLATDIDPVGGVLLLTGLDDALEGGVRAEVVEHRVIRVTLFGPLQHGSTEVRYRVSNGLAEAEGVVTIIDVPPPLVPQPPVAADDRASVRTGDVIDIPVLANDEHPDGDPLTLSPELVAQPERGLAFVSDDRLRYLAPDRPGEYRAEYRVDGPDGQNASAVVVISVTDADPASNRPPVPSTVTARALAGETVRIPVPLTGIDPDGDSVQLLGQVSVPERGTVVATGADQLEYTAGEYSSGTDTFRYEVMDALGARATATVRVGIAPRPDGARAPVASRDVLTVRPGRTVAVRALANDTDPDGGPLSIVGVESNAGDAEAEVVDDAVVVQVPPREGRYSFVYEIRNEQQATASSYIQIDADADAPLSAPEVSDVVLGLSEIVGRDHVDVDVLESTFIADAPQSRPRVGLVRGYDDGAVVRERGDVRIEIQDRRRIVPFTIGHPDDPTLTATAFILVPGRDDAVPQLRRDAPAVRVDSGEEVRLDLDDYVIAASGRPVRIADRSSVLASHGDGGDLVVDEDTVRFRSEAGYFGPASISFVAADGDPSRDPDARSGTIVIPIQVRPAEGLPPAFTGAVVDLQPDQSKRLGLDRLTSRADGDGDEASDLAYTLGPVPEGFTVDFDDDDNELTVRADGDAPHGLRASLRVAVADASGEGTPGTIELRVVPSTRPLAEPVPDHAVAARGRTTVIDVLENDQVGNPFPQTPLRVIGVRGAEAGSSSGAVRVTPSDDRSRLTVTVSESARPGNTTVQYQVADATGDPSRYAWGTVVISVQDRPEPVTDARVTAFGDRSLSVAFGAGPSNNAPISGYEITLVDAVDGEVVGRSDCATTTCAVPTRGNGQGAAVLVRVQARNAIGLSDAVEVAGAVWSDVVPGAPAGVQALPLDGRLRVQWRPVDPGSGSPVRSYVVTVAGVATEVSSGAACTSSLCSVDSQALANGGQVPVSVSARNEAYPALTAWNSAGAVGTPFGAPIAGAIQVAADPAAGAVTVVWSPFDGNGDAIGGYFVQQLVPGATGAPGGPQACGVTTPAPGTVVAPTNGGSVAASVRVGPEVTSVQFTGTTAEATTYSFIVWGYNRAGCVHTDVAGTVVRDAPAPVSGVTSEMAWLGDSTWDRYVSGVQTTAPTVQIVSVDRNGVHLGAPRAFAGSGWLRELLGRPYGDTAYFQVRGCAAWGSCGPWSATTPAGESPSLTFQMPGRAWIEGERRWVWAGQPDNGGLRASFSCGLDGDQAGRAGTGHGSCEVPGARPGDRVWLDVEVAGVTARFWNR